MQTDSREVRIGLLSAVTAHLLWGVFPIFWRQLGDFDAMQVVCHRVLWSFVTLAIYLPFMWRGFDVDTRQKLKASVQTKKIWLIYAAAAGLIAVNWLTFIWAVNHDRVLEASLGYYINPLLNVLLGVVILRERLGTVQWLAVAIAAIGVAYMTISIGSLPWIALLLSTSFATYALLKKQMRGVGPIESLAVEVTLVLLPALIYLTILGRGGEGAFGADGARVTILLILTGVATALPLLLFGAAARLIKLSTIGLLQYIAPSLQFLIGVFVYGEVVGRDRLIGFVLVWFALAIYTGHGLARLRRGEPQPLAV